MNNMVAQGNIFFIIINKENVYFQSNPNHGPSAVSTHSPPLIAELLLLVLDYCLPFIWSCFVTFLIFQWEINSIFEALFYLKAPPRNLNFVLIVAAQVDKSGTANCR